jgi:DNA-binding beta-propeller fold protein YncE
VANTNNNRIQVFTNGGAFVTAWGTQGAGNGQFQLLTALALDSSGKVFVADDYNNRIQKFTADGTFITKWGSFGSGDGQFNYPDGVAVDAEKHNERTATPIATCITITNTPVAKRINVTRLLSSLLARPLWLCAVGRSRDHRRES